MAENETLEQHANRERWCMEKVPEGQEDWPQGGGWHPLRGHCKRRGKAKIGGQWRCKKHLPTDPK
jgi:hypothetical protein